VRDGRCHAEQGETVRIGEHCASRRVPARRISHRALERGVAPDRFEPGIVGQRLHTKESALDGDGRGKWTIVQDGRRSAGASVDRPAVAGKNSTRRHEATETNGSQFDGWPGDSRAHGRTERSARMSLYEIAVRLVLTDRSVRPRRCAPARRTGWSHRCRATRDRHRDESRRRSGGGRATVLTGASINRPATAGKNSTRSHNATETNGSQFDGWPGNSRAHGRIEQSARMSLYGSRFDSFSRIVRSVRGAARRPSNWMVSSVS